MLKNLDIKVEKFECRRGNLLIWGKKYIPVHAHEEDKKIPAIIISHEFMVTSYSVEHYAKIFAQLGYAAFVFDFCGGSVHSKSEGRTNDMTVFTEAQDLMAVYEYVKSLDTVDPEQIRLLGCSQGGLVSAIVATKLKEKIAGLIMFYPALCIPDECRRGRILDKHFDVNKIPETILLWGMQIGREYVASVLDMDTYEYLAQYKGPVLLVHGKKDDVVSFNYSKKAHEKYQNSELLLINGAGHGFDREQVNVAVEAVEKFIKNM